MINALLVLSSAYCNAELQAEFGPIPAAAVPVGGTSLFQILKSTLSHDLTFVTVPFGASQFWDDDTRAIHLNPSMSVYEAAHKGMVAINDTLHDDYQLHVIHGDTLITKLMTTSGVGVVSADPSFKWLELGDKSYCGYFTATKSQIIQSGFDMESLIRTPAQHVFDGHWYDFGHAATYWNSRSKFLSTRNFNDLKVGSPNFLIKRGPPLKIKAEFKWFNEIPNSLTMYTPRVAAHTDDSYLIQYTPAPSLAEIWVHGNKPTDWWVSTLTKCLQFVDECAKHPWNNNTDPLFLIKSRNRLKDIPWDSTLTEVAIDELSTLSLRSSVIHGDFCFSNILYESRINEIRTIDPRGLNSAGGFDISGSVLYDLAKLFHSVRGGYDFIVAGADNPVKYNHDITELLEMAAVARGFSIRHLYLATGVLFVSMVPLHMKEDSARAARLYLQGKKLLEHGFSL